MLMTVVSLVGTLAMVLSWLILRSITNPLVRFRDHLEQLEAKQGNDRLFVLDEKAPQELQLLTTSFNQMQQRLNQQQTELASQMNRLHEQALILERNFGTSTYRTGTADCSISNQATTQLLQIICDNVPDLIWAKDLQHRYLFSNKANNDTLLYPDSQDEPLGKQHDFFVTRIMSERPDVIRTGTAFSDLCAQSDETTLTSQQPMQFQVNSLLPLELAQYSDEDMKGLFYL